MAETSLYRRHRPQSFDEVVGQEHVVRTLRNAIERDRVHHAYLFVGSRGTGKTSMAKILARSLNCVEGPTATPCGECESCRAIAAGTSLDVIEMDAASNRSVDDIRDLRERVGYAPLAGRWKVYILDEAHMLTREAWNAFLKTLEEPPPHTVFVLATTEAHKVMPTIVDRCQRFDFGRPSPEQITEVVQRVAAAEGIEIEPPAIAAIARAAAGSFRDALGTLDQLVAYAGTEIATADVLAVLGVADAELLFGAADALASGDGRAVLGLTADLVRSGRDPSRFAVDLVAHLRQLLVVATLGEVPTHFFASDEHASRLGAQARSLGEPALLRSIDVLSEAIAAVREGDDPRMTVELALLRVARPEIDPSRAALTQRLERLERRAPGGHGGTEPVTAEEPAGVPASGRGAQAPDEREAAPSERGGEPSFSAGAGSGSPLQAIAQGAVATVEEVRARVEEVRDEVTSRAEEVRAEVETPLVAAGQALDLERLGELWPAIIDQLRQSGSEFLSAAFQAARPVAVDPERATVEIGFPPDASFNKRKAEARENRERFTEALRTIAGARFNPIYVLLDGGRQPEVRTTTEEGAGEADERDLIERLKSEFDAEELIEGPEPGQATDAAKPASPSKTEAPNPNEEAES